VPAAARGDGTDTVASLTGAGQHCLFPTGAATGACSSTVFVNGMGAVRQGDAVAPHRAAGCGLDGSTLTTFSGTVRIEALGAGRLGDQYTSDNTITSGSASVFIGG
jgi:uncharacterized Zn-binding protein involved in type VI secretion